MSKRGSVLLVTAGPTTGSLAGYATGLKSALSDWYDIGIYNPESQQRLRPSPPGSDKPAGSESRILEVARTAKDYIGHALRSHGNYDIVHFCSQRLAFLATDASRDVITVHDVFPFGLESINPGLWDAYNRSPANATLHKFFRFTLKRAHSKGIELIADSRYTREELLRSFGIALGPDRVVPFPLNPDIARLEKSEARRRLGLDRNGSVVLSVSSLEPRKNNDAVIHLINRARVPFTTVRVGRFSLEHIIPQRRGHVVVLQGISEEVLSACYSAADLLFLPSWAEGFGVPALEAMACGLPIVCSSTPALEEVAGAAALRADASDYEGLLSLVESLLLRPLVREEMSAVGVSRSRDYTLRNIAPLVSRVYDRLIAANQ